MLNNAVKKDLRSIKTEKTLSAAMSSLLKNRNFGKLTVRDICEEALISRTTFYAHFNDKYDLLKYWLIQLKSENINKDGTYEEIEKTFNQFVYKNKTVIKNLVYDADEETLGILFEIILSSLDISDIGRTNPKRIVLSNFCAGGMIYYFLWQAKNNFPSDVTPMNKYVFEVIANLSKWGLECNA